MTEQPNNIILLSADALRADHLSCYGYERETSPNIDSLYKKSLSFEHAYSASSHTREAIPALLTGQYPDRAVDDNYRLKAETIASLLSDHGIKTGGFHSNPYASRAFGFDEGFDRFYDDLYLGGNKFIALAQRALDLLLNRHYARAEKINRLSLSWLDSLDADDSFFLWNHYMDTHGPYEPPAEFDIFQRPTAESKFEDPKSLYKRAVSDPESITDAEHDHLLDSYDGEIRYLDYHIGEFMEALESRNFLEDSTVIFTSDHGDAFGEHGFYGHPRSLHRELTRVPMFVECGDKTERSISGPATTLDIVPTILERSGLSIDGFPGTSLLNQITRKYVQTMCRGEDDKSGMQRYGIHGLDSWLQLEVGPDSSHRQFSGSTTDETLVDTLNEFIEGRPSRDSLDSPDTKKGGNLDDTNGDIEDRLEALGYK